MDEQVPPQAPPPQPPVTPEPQLVSHPPTLLTPLNLAITAGVFIVSFGVGAFASSYVKNLFISSTITPLEDIQSVATETVQDFSISPWISFQATSSIFFEKDGQIYVQTSVVLPVIGADIDTFLVPYYSGRHYVFAKDKNFVYHTSYDSIKIVKGADPKTLDVYRGAPFAKDSQHVYTFQKGQIVEGADPKTFVPIGFHVGKDSTSVYIGSGYKLVNADPDTFVVLNEKYGKDTRKVYSLCDLAPLNCSPGVISGADPDTFTLVPDHKDYDAQDRNHKYYLGEIVE